MTDEREDGADRAHMADLRERLGREEVALQARDEALRLWAWEPSPTRAGENAGTRTEGRRFATEMRTWLARPGYVVVTALGKSSNGTRVDGNAHVERVTFKMLRFKMNPLNRDRTLVVALNCAFTRYRSAARELQIQAAYLNGLSPFAPIVVLITEDDYHAYFAAHDVEDDIED